MLETQSLFSGLDRNAAMLPRAVAASQYAAYANG